MPNKGYVYLESDDEMGDWEYIQPVLQRFANRNGLFISVRNPHGRSSAPIQREGQLHVRFWSAPGEITRTILDEAFGVQLQAGANGDGCLPSGTGIVIRDRKGTAVAELVDDTLYILFDLPHRLGEYNSTKLMGTIMKEVQKIFKAQGRKPGVLDFERNFIELFRRRDGLLEMNPARIRAKWEELLSVLKEQPIVIGNEIRFTLGPIQFVGHGSDDPMNLGSYEVVFNTRNGSVTFHPKSERGKRHPHIFSDGSACLGNIDDGMTRFIRDREFAFAVELITIYLERG